MGLLLILFVDAYADVNIYNYFCFLFYVCGGLYALDIREYLLSL